MMLPFFLTDLAAYSAQVLVVAAVGGMVSAMLRRAQPVVRHTFWRLLLGLCLALPLVQARESVPLQGSHAPRVSVAIDTAFLVAPNASGGLNWNFVAGAVIAVGAAGRLMWILVGLVRLRRLRAGEAAQLATEDADLQRQLRIRAEVRYATTLQQPVTFGVFSPVVLLPLQLRDQSPAIRHAVLCHELVHVWRRDWAWLVGEEIVRAALWFHPAIWWLVSQIQATREQVVDEHVVAITRNRRAYMAALLSFGDQSTPASVTAFGQRNRLVQRLTRLSKESRMPRKYLVVSCAVVALTVILASRYAVAAFPLQTRAAGPSERQTNAITPENPIPRRTYSVAPSYPPGLAQSGLDAFVTAQVVLDASGRIVETRQLHQTVSRNSDDSRTPALPVDAGAPDQFWVSVDDALRQWQYEPPSMAPIAFPVSFRFMSDREGIELNATPAPFDPAPIWHAGAVSVGDDIRRPTKTKDVVPVYPEAAQSAKVQGVVLIEVRVEPDGHISNTRLMRSIPQLDQAALEAVKRWEFAPTLDRSGQATPVIMTVTVRFTLT